MAVARTAPEALAARVQELTDSLDALGDPMARALAEDLSAAVVDLYGEGLERIFAALETAGPAGAAIRDDLAEDGVVASLMLIHDLYPVGLEERVVEALDKVRPYMETHGGNVELLGVEGGVARLRLDGSCNGCAASASTLELAIKTALEEDAPDLLGLEVEGVVEPEPAPAGFVLPVVHEGDAPAEGAVWHDLDGAASGLAPGDLGSVQVGRSTLVLANVGGTLYAYADDCAACHAPLHGGGLRGGVLTCSGCAQRYYLPGAGRAIGGERLQLEPVPLLAKDGEIRVAVAT